MPKLHEIVAIAPSKKSDMSKRLTEAHQGWKPDKFTGFTKTYTPKDEKEGEKFPPENKPLQIRVPEEVRKLLPELTDTYNIVASQDEGNTRAKADIEVDGKVVLKNVPVETLIFLEKQLTDLETFIEKLPVLSPDREWKWDDVRNCYVTDPVQKSRTQKVQKVVVMYPATIEHPAQTQLVSEDVIIGYTHTTDFSGAIKTTDKQSMLAKVKALHIAVVQARTRANTVDANVQNIGKPLMDFIFSGIVS